MAGANELTNLAQLSVSASQQSQLPSVLSSVSGDFNQDIPVVDTPSLDSILNDDMLSAPTVDDLGLTEILNDESASPVPSFSSESYEDEEKRQSQESSILRQTSLQGIANQLTRANVRSGAGLPTVLTAGSVYMYYVIGTSRGLVLVFDKNEHLKCVLSPYEHQKTSEVDGQYGAVSALDLSFNGERLLVGYARGLITHWDLSSHRLLRMIEDVHPPGFAVINIKFTDDPSVMLFSNSGGNVFFLKFTRNLVGIRNWNSECFFSGCNGEALTFEPLRLEEMPNHPLKEYCIIAIATVTQILMVTIAPKLNTLISFSLKGRATSLPLLAWQFVIIEHKGIKHSKSSVYPVLASVRENTIVYVQAECIDGQPKFELLRRVKVDYSIVAFKWINAHTVVAMDTTERVHLINVRDDTQIEVLDLNRVELLYGSSFFKSIETGGNVSKALIVGSEHACYNSVVCSRNQLLLLGIQSLHMVTLKPWKERLASLVRENKIVDAIELGIRLYEGKANAVVGLSGPTKKRKELVAVQVMDILQGFIDLKLIVSKPSTRHEKDLKPYYQGVAKIAFNTCLRINKLDLLYGPIYETFSGEGDASKAVFLETLQHLICDGRVKMVRTTVLKHLIDYYSRLNKYELLQQCFLNINPVCLDIHQVVELCWSQRLYKAMIHVYNECLNDYVKPLLELLLQLRAALKKSTSLTEEYQKIGYELLVYIRCCLSGLAYPSGNIPPKRVLLAKTSVYETLLAPINTHHTADKASYPHIRTLLAFDTREFLNVIAFAFEEQDFDRVQAGEDLPGIPTRQEIVNVLLEVMIKDKNSNFSPSQVGSLFTFIARQAAKHRTTIQVDENIYDQVLNYITEDEERIINEERQQALLELWHSGVLQKFDEERLLIMAESARFYRLCELLYQKRGLYARVLSCYVRDPNRRNHSFSYIHQLMTENQYSDADREECTRAVLDCYDVLISTDVKATAQLILMDFPLELAEVTYKLQSNPDMQFQFLDGVFDPKIASKQQDIQPPNHVAERYIELLCQFQPENVYPFLRINDCYRLEEALDVCAAANVIDATSYLLERTGDVKGAFKLILQTFESNLASFCDRFSQPLDSSAAEDTVGQQDVLQSLGVESSRNDDFQSQLERVEVVLRTLLQFCQRNSVRADEKSRQAMWLPMFDQLLGMLYQCQDTPTNLLQALKRMFSEVLNGMMGYVQLPEILRRIIEDPSYGSGQFKDIKPILMKMLETYNYEETLLKTTNHIMVHDVQASLSLLCSLSHKGMIPSSTNCSLCNRPVYAANNEAPIEEVAVFSCGHLYHAPCLSASHPTLGVSCLLCDKSSKASDRSRAVAVRSWDMKNSADPYHRKQALAKSEGSQLDHSQLQQLRRLTRSFSHTTDTVAPVELILAPPKLEHSH